jgi:predicted dinucleotide-binding enzyme
MGDISGKVLVDCNNPLKWDDGPVHTPPPEGSLTAALAKAFPMARVLKGFSTFGAEFHLDPKLGSTNIDVQLAGDDAEAKALVSSIASRAGFTPVDAGPLRNAALLESLAILWIHLAMRGGHGREIGFKLLKRG